MFAAEVLFDCTKLQVPVMDQLLLQYACSAMGLPARSVRLLLLMDNAVFEVRHRQLELTARFVEYAWSCKPERPVHLALLDSMLLSQSAYKHGWYSSFSSRVAALGVDPMPRRGWLQM